ncbi:MAG TPA: hypothetical protein VFA33_06400 [Bryobacteraceae bacterium]|nr:hypothetical protein [Bryobacteraceae bacterium]
MKRTWLIVASLMIYPLGGQQQTHPSYSISAQNVLDDIKRVGTIWFSNKDQAFSDHLTSLTVQLGKNPRIQSEYTTLLAKPEAEREAWLAMLFVNAYYAGYSRGLSDAQAHNRK